MQENIHSVKTLYKATLLALPFSMGDRKTVEKISSSYHCCNLAEEDRNKKVGIAIVGLIFSSLLDILISQWHMQEYNP